MVSRVGLFRRDIDIVFQSSWGAHSLQSLLTYLRPREHLNTFHLAISAMPDILWILLHADAVKHDPALLIGACILLLLIGCKFLSAKWNSELAGLPLPPGPKGYPLVGNVLDIPRLKPWLKYREWQSSYGELCGNHDETSPGIDLI